MNLIQLRQEVVDHGFDPIQYGAKINRYLNDALNLIARRVDYYEDEAVYAFSTVAGTDLYAWPTDFARMRSLMDLGRNVEMGSVAIRQIDASGPSSGAPAYYAQYNGKVRLFPTPDGVYSMQMRYWKMPTALANDTDVPALPSDWTHLLWVYACARCFENDDDPQTAQYWDARFDKELSQFSSDQKFPDSDSPTQVKGMWGGDEPLAGSRWGLYLG